MHATAIAIVHIIVSAIVATAAAPVAAASWMPWIKFVRVGCWQEDGEP